MASFPGVGCHTLLCDCWLTSWPALANAFLCGASSQLICKDWRLACCLSPWAAYLTDETRHTAEWPKRPLIPPLPQKECHARKISTSSSQEGLILTCIRRPRDHILLRSSRSCNPRLQTMLRTLGATSDALWGRLLDVPANPASAIVVDISVFRGSQCLEVSPCIHGPAAAIRCTTKL